MLNGRTDLVRRNLDYCTVDYRSRRLERHDNDQQDEEALVYRVQSSLKRHWSSLRHSDRLPKMPKRGSMHFFPRLV